MTTPTGVITSPNYPNMYGNHDDCSWVIEVGSSRPRNKNTHAKLVPVFALSLHRSTRTMLFSSALRASTLNRNQTAPSITSLFMTARVRPPTDSFCTVAPSSQSQTLFDLPEMSCTFG